mgnify:CR=1 FL=1
MSTLASSPVQEFPDTSTEKKAYNIAESFASYIPVPNDRYRLGFQLYRHLSGDGETIPVAIKTARLTLKGITEEQLISQVTRAVDAIRS